MTETERRIRERAYSIWQQQGEPSGQELDHWHQASKEIAEQGESQTPAAEPSVPAKPRKGRTKVATEDTKTPEKPSRARKAPAAAAPRKARAATRPKSEPKA